MASDIDICNIALAHLGDTATVASINPPEGSAQSEHCARFYPIARDSLLEMHDWGFATKRIALSQLSYSWPQWDYAYAYPQGVIRILAVLPPDAQDDYSTRFAPTDVPGYYQNVSPVIAAGRYVPQAYQVESAADGARLILTDQENATCRYLEAVTDTTKFTPLFVTTLTWQLASMLAGPVIKGDQGAAEAKRCQQMMAAYLAQARASEANQRNIKPEHIVNWMAGR